ncbi:MAG: ribonuclease H [Chloroflexi bacterium]|nr:ribonuclease H [Chloroflexota bacterium]
MGKPSRYYVVWVGRKPGVYDSWDAARAQVEGYPDARYKGFPSRELAERAFRLGPEGFWGEGRNQGTWRAARDEILLPALVVDAAAPDAPHGPAMYRGVALYPDGRAEEVFRVGPLQGVGINVAEFLALVHGLAWLEQRGLDWPVFSDSVVARAWVRKGKPRVQVPLTPEARGWLERATRWLQAHPDAAARVHAWTSQRWGEIPADFGNKAG